MPVKKRIVGMRNDVPYVLCFGGLSDKRIQRDTVQCILEQGVQSPATPFVAISFLRGNQQGLQSFFGKWRPDNLLSHASTSLLIVTSSCPSPSSSCRQAFLRSWRSRVENARTCFVCWDDCSSLTFAITLSPFSLKHFKVMNCLRGKIRS